MTKHDLMAVMVNHSGAQEGISAKALANTLGVPERQVRHFVTQCREDGIAICGHPGTGYFVAQTPDEMKTTLEFLKHRALHSLKLASTLSKLPLADLIGQLHLKT